MKARQTLALVEPSVERQAAALSMIEEFTAAGEDRYRHVLYLVRHDFPAYVRQLQDQAREIGLPPGFVPQSTFWTLRRDAVIVGVSRLRHQLTPALNKEGGHIGYAIRPSQRGKGYGTRQLALTLEKARQQGLRRVLVTCDTDNLASARVIEKNGGKLENRVISDFSGKLVSRYWIELS